MDAMIRVFVAIPLGRDAVQGLEQVRARLRRPSLDRTCRWVKPENIHLTLKFLGDVPASRVAAIEGALAAACQGSFPFVVHLAELGCFPNASRPRVVWVGVQGDLDPLIALQRQVEASLVALGFPPERRGFHPHLTLARVNRHARHREVVEVGHMVQEAQIGHVARLPVKVVHLIKSELGPAGPIYTTLACFELEP